MARTKNKARKGANYPKAPKSLKMQQQKASRGEMPFQARGTAAAATTTSREIRSQSRAPTAVERKAGGFSHANSTMAAGPLDLDYGSSQANPITLDDDDDDERNDKGARNPNDNVDRQRDGDVNLKDEEEEVNELPGGSRSSRAAATSLALEEASRLRQTLFLQQKQRRQQQQKQCAGSDNELAPTPSALASATVASTPPTPPSPSSPQVRPGLPAPPDPVDLSSSEREEGELSDVEEPAAGGDTGPTWSPRPPIECQAAGPSLLPPLRSAASAPGNGSAFYDADPRTMFLSPSGHFDSPSDPTRWQEGIYAGPGLDGVVFRVAQHAVYDRQLLADRQPYDDRRLYGVRQPYDLPPFQHASYRFQHPPSTHAPLSAPSVSAGYIDHLPPTRDYPTGVGGPSASSPSRQQLSAHAHPYYPGSRHHQQRLLDLEDVQSPQPQPPPGSSGSKRKRGNSIDTKADANFTSAATPATNASPTDPRAKLLKRKSPHVLKAEAEAIAVAKAKTKASVPVGGSRKPSSSPGHGQPSWRTSQTSARSWTDKEKQVALELVAKLAACGMPPSKLILEGVNVQIVRACCEELGIPFDGDGGVESVSQPSTSQGDASPVSGPLYDPAAQHLTASTVGAADGTVDGADAMAAASRSQLQAKSGGGSDPALELRLAALATLRRKVIASRAAKAREEVEQNPETRVAAVNKLLKQAQQNAMLTSGGGDASDGSSPAYEPPEPEATSEVEAAADRVPMPSKLSSSLDDAERGVCNDEDDGDDDSMTLEISGSEAEAAVTPVKVRTYRDVDRPAGSPTLNFDFAGAAAAPPARRLPISYADDFSRKPGTPAGEVDLNAPLPTLALPPPPASSEPYPYHTIQSNGGGSGSINGNAFGHRRRRPVAADFDGPPLLPQQYGGQSSPARPHQFLRQPFRTKLIIDVSDSEDDDQDDDINDGRNAHGHNNVRHRGDCSNGRAALNAVVRRRTTEAIYALYLADRGLPAPLPPQLPKPKEGATSGTVTPARREASLPASSATLNTAASADTPPNGELLKKEQDIKLLLLRIQALEKKKQNSGGGGISASISDSNGNGLSSNNSSSNGNTDSSTSITSN